MATRALGDAKVTKRIVITGKIGESGNEGNSTTSSGDGEPNTSATDGDVGTPSSDGIIDPASLSGSADADAPYGRFANGKPRKRSANGSRASGSGGGRTRKSASETSQSLSAILFSVHAMASHFVPVMELDKEESSKLAEAITNVTELYDMPLMDEKTLAWIQLCMVAGTIYGPRVVVAMRAKNNAVKPGPVPVGAR